MTLLLWRTPTKQQKTQQLRKIPTSKWRTAPRTRRDAPTKNAQRKETLHANDSYHRDRVESSSNRTHQCASGRVAKDISNDTEIHASQLGGYPTKLVGREREGGKGRGSGWDTTEICETTRMSCNFCVKQYMTPCSPTCRTR